MSVIQAILIAIVQGLTEFLPVSSTGHMIITQNILGVESDEFVKAFTVIIQFATILSVVILYWKRFFKMNSVRIFDNQSTKGEPASSKFRIYSGRFLYKYDFYVKLFIAFIPALVLGFLFSDLIDKLLEKVSVVAVMLIIGGIFMLFVDKWFSKTDKDQQITGKKAFIIGLFQCIAMIPGVSRSMATIVGGMSQRLTRQTAAEFSFFLAVPTMLAASAFKLLKLLMNPEGFKLLIENLLPLSVGCFVAFIIAIIAIKGFIAFLQKYGFRFFGYYRIAAGLIILIFLLLGYNLKIG